MPFNFNPRKMKITRRKTKIETVIASLSGMYDLTRLIMKLFRSLLPNTFKVRKKYNQYKGQQWK